MTTQTKMTNNRFNMSKIHILEQLLDEGQSVRGMALGILSRAGVKDAEGVLDTLASLPVSNDLGARTIAQVEKNEKALIPVVNWYVGARDWSQPYTDRDEASVIEDIGDAIRKIYSYETTRNYNGGLTAIQARYRTLGKLEAWLEAESKDNRNIKMDKGGYNFPELLAYSDKGVDVYKASNPMEAIALSKGYSFCIGQPGGNNMFYSYRNDPKDATAYFCWFKDEQGKKNHEDMCVLHVGSDGRYRLTGSGNHGSPIVDKQRVLSEYPALRGALESGKLTTDEYSEDEKAVQHIRPMSLVELDDATKGYTPTSIAILIGKGCVFSDDFFDYVWEEVDKGRYKDAGYDSLIRKYVLAGFTRLSPHQKEVLEGAGYGREVQASEVRVRRHWEQEQMAYFERAVERGDIKFTETDVYRVDVIRKYSIVRLYCPLDKPIVLSNVSEEYVHFEGALWGDEDIRKVRLADSVTYIDDLSFNNCTYLNKIELDSSFSHITVGSLGVKGCSNLQSLRGIDVLGIFDELVVEKCNNIQTLEGMENVTSPEYVTVRDCARFRSLRGISDETTFDDGRPICIRLQNLPSYVDIDYLPNNVNPNGSAFLIEHCPIKSLSGVEWILDLALDKNKKVSSKYHSLAGYIIVKVFDQYMYKYEQMKKDMPASLLGKMQDIMQQEYKYSQITPDMIHKKDGVSHLTLPDNKLMLRGKPFKDIPTVKIGGRNYLDVEVDGEVGTCPFMWKLDYFPLKINDRLEYLNRLCADLTGITPDINTLFLEYGTEYGLTSLKGLKKVSKILICPTSIPASWFTSIQNEPVEIGSIYYLNNEAFTSNPELVKAMIAFNKKHPNTKLFDGDEREIDLEKYLRESHTPAYHNLMHTLNAVNEAGFMDKVSGYLDKVDPDRSKMRGLAKTALALMGGGELDDSVGLIKDRRDASHVDTEQAEDILRDVVLKLGRSTSEINAFLRLPEKERTEKVKKALQEVIYKQYKVSRSEGRVLERELYAKIKRSLWDNYKVTLSEGLPPTVNFEGEQIELTTTESNEIQDIVDNVQRLIEKDMSEDDLTSPAGQKALMKLCLRFAKADKAKAKKAFVQLLKQFDTK